jgi:hypothetical protein
MNLRLSAGVAESKEHAGSEILYKTLRDGYSEMLEISLQYNSWE